MMPVNADAYFAHIPAKDIGPCASALFIFAPHARRYLWKDVFYKLDCSEALLQNIPAKATAHALIKV